MKLTKIEISLIIAMFVSLIFTSTSVSSFNETSEKLLRFHVLANSNEDYDQELKLEVKNQVFSYISDLTNSSNSLEDASIIINQNIENINALATKVVVDNGYNYEVSTTLENEFYPQKTYENFILPAGYYNGVKIRIGESVGENWWCVLYPPLCNETAFDTKNLTDNELELISGSYEFRFKFLDLYSKIVEKLK